METVVTTKKMGVRELAMRANVSPATVSRVLNGNPNVNKAVYKRVMALAHNSSYTPRKVTGKRTIGVVIADFDDNDINSYANSVLMHINKHCHLNNLGMEIITTSDLKMLEDNFIKSAIMITSGSTPTIQQRARTQFICINSVKDGFPGVISDHTQGIQLALEFLGEKNYIKPALILTAQGAVCSKERSQAFLASNKKYGMEIDEDSIEYLNPDSVVEHLAKVLRRCSPDALIVGGEDLVLPVNYALNLLGYEVGKDIAVISYENSYISKFMTPPHTTIAQDFDHLAAEAVKLAMIGLNKPLRNDSRIIIPCRLIERESVKNRRV
jgi:LacI family transcriptional regulator